MSCLVLVLVLVLVRKVVLWVTVGSSGKGCWVCWVTGWMVCDRQSA
ncbi:hypothetical protein [Streptomyces sp. NPDC059479]